MTASPSRDPLKTLVHLLFTYGCYVLLVLPFLASPTTFPGHDNIKYHLLNYTYFSNSLRYGFGLPAWYPSYGGVPVAISSFSLFPFAPYRLIGYLLYVLLPLETVTLYKITLVVGVLVTATGWWLFLRRLTGSRSAATFGSLMVLLGGTGITLFHQEQIIATIMWGPWALWALLRVRERPGFVLLLAVLLGFMMTVHYPQIHVLSIVFLAAALGATCWIRRSFFTQLLGRRRLLPAAAALFFLSVSPTLYVYGMMGDFSSPLRETAGVEVSTYEDYIRVNRSQESSATAEYLGNYLYPSTEGSNDRFAFYATTLGLLFVIPALVFRGGLALPALVVFVLSAWASLGVNGYLPQLLFLLKVPSIQYFRQWYHFAPIMNLCLSALGAIGFSVVADFAWRRTGRLKEGAGWLATGLLLLVATGVVFYQSSRVFKGYVAEHMIEGITSARLDRESFLRFLTGGTFEFGYPGPLVVYREWFSLTEACPDLARRRRPFITRDVRQAPADASPAERRRLLKDFCEAGLSRYAVLGDATGGDGALLSLLRRPGEAGRLGPTRNRRLARGSYRYTPRGAYFNGAVAADSLLVLPFNYKLGLRAYLNGESVRTYPVYDGAMTGVFIPGGPYSLRVEASLSGYVLTVLLQGALLAGVILLLSVPSLRPSRPGP
ncbi:MAG: hypothetical protein ACE5EI_03580 [Thermodesulfobacteriota bacterium]